jgi:hypothetical protein
MHRPRGITWTAALMVFAVLVGIVHSFIAPLPPAHHIAPAIDILLARVLPYAFVALECACVWAYWAGVESARILVLIDCVLELIALHRFMGLWHRYPNMAALHIGKAFLAVFLLWYLFQPKVRAWFAGSVIETGRDGPDNPAQHSQPTA